jgi:hypothetical protein
MSSLFYTGTSGTVVALLLLIQGVLDYRWGRAERCKCIGGLIPAGAVKNSGWFHIIDGFFYRFQMVFCLKDVGRIQEQAIIESQLHHHPGKETP